MFMQWRQTLHRRRFQHRPVYIKTLELCFGALRQKSSRPEKPRKQDKAAFSAEKRTSLIYLSALFTMRVQIYSVSNDKFFFFHTDHASWRTVKSILAEKTVKQFLAWFNRFQRIVAFTLWFLENQLSENHQLNIIRFFRWVETTRRRRCECNEFFASLFV